MEEIVEKDFPQRLRAVFIAALISVIYVLLMWYRLAEYPQGADSSEFIYSSTAGGLVHPPGYPWFSWLCETYYQWQQGNPFLDLAKLNLILQTIATFILFQVIYFISTSLIFASISVVTWLCAPATMHTSSYIEVFSAHHVVINVILFLATIVLLYPQKNILQIQTGKRRFYFFSLGLMCGLGGSHHQTIILIAPYVVSVLWNYVEGTVRNKTSQVSLFFLGVCVGLLPYLHLFSRYEKDDKYGFGKIENAEELLKHILRTMYGTFSFGPSSQEGFLNIPIYKDFLSESIVMLPLLLLVPFLLKTFSPGAKKITIPIIMTLINVLLFLSQLHFIKSSEGILIVQRFYPMLWIMCMPASAYCYRFCPRRLRMILIATAMFGIVYVLPRSIEASNANEDNFVNILYEDINHNTSSRSIFLTNSDPMFFLLNYKLSQQKGFNAEAMSESLLSMSWYVEQLKKRIPILNTLVFKDGYTKYNFRLILQKLNKENYKIYMTPLSIDHLPEDVVAFPRGPVDELVPKSRYSKADFNIANLNRCLSIPTDIQKLNQERKTSLFLLEIYYLRPLKLRASENDEFAQDLRHALDALFEGDYNLSQQICRDLLKKYNQTVSPS